MMIRMVKEPATRVAMMVAEEAHMADLPKDLQDVAIAAGPPEGVRLDSRYRLVLFYGRPLLCTP